MAAAIPGLQSISGNHWVSISEYIMCLIQWFNSSFFSPCIHKSVDHMSQSWYYECNILLTNDNFCPMLRMHIKWHKYYVLYVIQFLRVKLRGRLQEALGQVVEIWSLQIITLCWLWIEEMWTPHCLCLCHRMKGCYRRYLLGVHLKVW